ncbi:MAG: hypothetical protein MJZ34_02755 [Paludibacteraceae bacterium]|nr:hypothetical protein [Paludibacteraceae bacterium]
MENRLDDKNVQPTNPQGVPEEKEDLSSDIKKGALVMGATGAAVTIPQEAKYGSFVADELRSRVHLKHGTSEAAKKSIQEQGLLKSHALDPYNITNRVARETGFTPIEAVYTQRSSASAKKSSHALIPTIKDNVVEIEIPWKDFDELEKAGKLIQENPELLGGKKWEEYYTAWRKTDAVGKIFKDRKLFYLNGGYPEFLAEKLAEFDLKATAKNTYKILAPSERNTVIIADDIATKFIKGSKDFNPSKFTDWLKYVKENPKRFLTGIGKEGKLMLKLAIPIALWGTAGAALGVLGYKLSKMVEDESAKDNDDMLQNENLKNFSRIAKKYFDSTNDPKTKKPISLADESYNISYKQCTAAMIGGAAISQQKTMLTNMLSDHSLEKDSPAIYSFNKLMKQLGRNKDIIDVGDMKADLSNNRVLQDTKKIFDYMDDKTKFKFSSMWRGQYEKVISKCIASGLVSENSKLNKLFKGASLQELMAA